MREIRLSSSMSGMWKRSMAWLMRHRLTKGPGTDRPDLNHRATSRLYDSFSFSGFGATSPFVTICFVNPAAQQIGEKTQEDSWLEQLPSRTTIYWVLERHGALDGTHRQRRPAPPKG